MLELLAQGLWKVALVGLLLGAGLPALFALGIRFSAAGVGGDAEVGHQSAHPAMKALGYLCFFLVVYAIALGITIIVASGIGMKLEFAYGVLPHLVEKSH